MSDNVSITPGSGVDVTTEEITADSSECQLFKLAVDGAGLRTKVPASAANGLTVDVTRIQGAVLVNNPTAADLKVDASGVAVPVTDNSGSLTVDGVVTSPVPVRLSDGSGFTDTIAVTGEVTADQGTAALSSGAWPTKLTDGTTDVTVDASSHGLKVFIAGGSSGGGTSAADNSAFTEGTTPVTPIAGEYNDSPSGPSSGQAAAARITGKRALHVNLRNNTGTEIGTAGAAVRTDPIGTTAQPISSPAVTAPIVVTMKGQGETPVRKSVALTASATSAAIWTPASGKKFVIRQLVIVITTGGDLQIQDAAGDDVANSGAASWPTGVFVIPFSEPWESATADNVLNFTSGSGLVGQIVTQGFEV